jgi:hypothetical protein
MNSKLTTPFALLLLFAFAACDGTSSYDKKIGPGDVPHAVVTSFAKKYPGAAEVTWERELDGADTVYEATFLYDDKKQDAEFDKNGVLAERD